MTTLNKIQTGNQAVANIAYKTNEVCAIYPCTPSTEMSELVEQWSSKDIKNAFGSIPKVHQMQSEAGVAGAMHGALQTGALATTFTASQGLLLMIPNMYKIAGQLIPNVIHVATRSIATHALSVFGDHSDIMAARQTGYAFLGSSSVQEAQDFALISQAASLKSRIPFVHFFDGFRTSHENNTITVIKNQTIAQLIESSDIDSHRERALNPLKPTLKGTSQGEDVFFESREAQNTYYHNCADIVQNIMDKFYILTKREYKLFDYVGHPNAEHVIISMASSTETIEETINQLNEKDTKFGLIKVRLFRPFSKKHLLNALPKTVKTITALDRTKEPGSSGEPLYLDIIQTLTEAYQNNEIKNIPKILGGRYGLSSKEFNPSMVYALFKNAKSTNPKQKFTIGIQDNVTNLSLDYSETFNLQKEWHEVKFYNSSKSDFSFKNLLKILHKNSDYIQGYTQCDYKKYNSRQVNNLRISNNIIKAPYLISDAHFIFCSHSKFIENDDALDSIKENGTLLINTTQSSIDFWNSLAPETQYKVKEKNVQLIVVNLKLVPKIIEVENLPLLNSHACYLYFNEKFKHSDKLKEIGNHLQKVNTDSINKTKQSKQEFQYPNTLLEKLITRSSNTVLVSELPVDGIYPINTSRLNPKQNSEYIPIWDSDICTQCGLCSMACPQGSLRIKAYNDSYLEHAPVGFKSIKSEDFDLMNYTIQNNSDQCNGCNNCVDACPVKALSLKERETTEVSEKNSWEYFKEIPEFNRSEINANKISEQQLQEPLFKYSIGTEGCGEAPYLKLLSQLFGHKLIIANATGASSIVGGALPTTPWSTNAKGHGPAWANSLFEDNAEFGLGIKLALEQQDKKDSSVWIVGGDGWAYDIGYGGIDHILSSGKNVNILVLDNEVYDNTGGQASKATPFGAQSSFNFNGKNGKKKNLGEIAMQHNDVYVASVAIGADPEQTLKAFNEAESYDGTSIIIAYCHSKSHGINMKTPKKYHEALVDSGQWLLYRKDPRKIKKGLNPFQLDSMAPKIKIDDYLKLENRYSKFLENITTNSKTELNAMQHQVDKTYQDFLRKSIT